MLLDSGGYVGYAVSDPCELKPFKEALFCYLYKPSCFLRNVAYEQRPGSVSMEAVQLCDYITAYDVPVLEPVLAGYSVYYLLVYRRADCLWISVIAEAGGEAAAGAYKLFSGLVQLFSSSRRAWPSQPLA